MEALRLMDAFTEENDSYVWEALLSQLTRIEALLQEREDPMQPENVIALTRFSKLIQRLLNNTFQKLGWEEINNESVHC